MNKERAREQLEQIKYLENEYIKECEKKIEEIKQDQINVFFETEKQKILIRESKDYIKALDIAIENLQQDQLDNDLVDKEVVRIINNGVDVNDREKEWQEKRVHIILKGLTEDECNLLEYYRASGLKIRILGEPYERKE